MRISSPVKFLLLGLGMVFSMHVAATDYYWIGDSGNWNDANHWSTSSSGRGGAGVPTANDDVYFDAGSFTGAGALQITTNSLCRNLFWNIPNAAPTVSGSGNLTVSGSFQFQSPFQNNYSGTLTFTATDPNQPLRFGDQYWNSDVVLNGTGSWVLQSPLYTNGEFSLLKGGLHTNNRALAAYRIQIDGTEQRALNLTQSSVVAVMGWDAEPSTNLQFNAAQSSIYISQQAIPQAIKLGGLTYNYIEHVGYDNGLARASNTCGTGAGETPFTIDAQMTVIYNNFGVSCKDSCDGEVTVTVTGGVGPFTFQWVGGPNTQDWIGVCAGSQIVIVTDQGQNIQCATTVNLPDPPRLSVLFSNFVAPTCFSSCDGQATAFAVGGVPNYSYCWNAPCPPGQAASNANTLCIGSNTLSIIDQNGCTFDTTFQIDVPAPVYPNLTISNVQCNGACDGYAVSNPVGGNGGPWTYAWTPNGETTDSIGALCPGTYGVTVTDVNGCTGDTTFTITEPPALIISLVNQVDLVCNGVCDGELEVSGSNGTSPYTYEWFFANTNISTGILDAHATGLCADDYYVIVTDDNGCQQQSPTYTITQPTPIVGTASSTDVTCNGACDGTASVSASGGVGPYTFQWFMDDGTPVGSGANISNLCPDGYYAEVTDAFGCVQNSDTVFVTEPLPLLVFISGDNVDCFDSCDGSGMLTITGGTAPYVVTWFAFPSNTPIGQNGLTATNLCDGNYYAQVVDAGGCTDNSPILLITQPSQITITTSSTDATCNGVCDGTASVSITGGTPGYSVQWFNSPSGTPTGQTGNSATNLCDGDYYAEVTDANGCVQQSSVITINEPPAINITSVPQNVSCGGACDGIISLVVSGGTPTYTITWCSSPSGAPIGQTGFNAINLCPGSYFAKVVDANGCVMNSPVETITEPTPLSGNINSTDATCNGDCDGSATAAGSGGTPPYTFAWFDCNNNTPIGQTTSTATDLCAGDYYAIITDDNNCSFTTACTTISEPPYLDVTLTTNDPQCFNDCNGSGVLAISGGTSPYTIVWSSSANPGLIENNLCDGSYTVTVTDANGCDTVIPFTLTEPSLLAGTLNPTDPSCNGLCDGSIGSNISGGTTPYTYQWTNSGGGTVGNGSDLLNACPDTYTLTVTDANGCTVTESATLTNPPGMTITVNSVTAASCGGVCNGAIDITVTGGTPGYTFDWITTLGGTQVSTNEDPTNLCPDDYTVIVTDASGCTETLSNALVTTNPLVTATLSTTDPTCSDVCDGFASVVGSGGTPPYTYNWTSPILGTIATTDMVNGLCGGNYAVEVTDAVGCTSAPVIFTINAPPAIEATTDSTVVTCGAGCDGTATVNVSGGTGALSIQWDAAANNQTTATATNLCAGVYDVTITDANGCSLDTFVEVTEPLTMNVAVAATNVSCSGDCNGAVFITSLSDGTPPYTYQWTLVGSGPINGATDDTLANQCAGSYFVTVTDAANCSVVSSTVTITQPTALNVNLAGQVDIICFGNCDGSATITVSGGTTPYTISWNDPANQNTLTAVNLCSGSYTATVTDANGCTGTANVIITEPSGFDVTSSMTPVTCNGGCDGTASVTVNNGATAPFTYSWNDPLNQNTQTAIGLCAGTYQVLITDANSCDTTVSVTVTEPATVIVTNTLPSDPTCNGSCDGQIVALVSGGSSPYTYLWVDNSNGAVVGNTDVASGLCAGTYDLLVTDANGCTATTQVTLTDVSSMVGTVSTTLSDCNLCNGTADIVVSGGVSPYSYQWTPSPLTGQGTPNATGLCGGVNSVTVTDANGCQETFPVLVSTIPAEVIEMDSTDISCNGVCDGQAIVEIPGGCGLPPCTGEWYDGSAANINQSFTITNTDTATGLCAGTYIVEVQNASGCIIFDSVSVNEPTMIVDNATVTDASCAAPGCNGEVSVAPTGGVPPYTYAWSTSGNTNPIESGLCAGNVTLTITDATGCSETFNYTITEPTALDVSSTATSNLNCNGSGDGTATVFPSGGTPPYSYVWMDCAGNPIGQTTQQATGLSAGDYMATVTDANGCTATTACLTLTEPSVLAVTFTINEPGCFGDCDGAITANPTGGTPNYLYQWMDNGMNPINGATGATITGLCAGDYFVNITDNNGCVLGPEQVTLTEPTSIDITISSTPITCNGSCDGTLTANVTGGVGFLTYQWYVNGNPIPAPTGTSSTLNNTCAGDYFVEVSDVNGCLGTSPVTTFSEPAALDGNITTAGVPCGGDSTGTATANVTGGTAPYTIEWLDPNGNPFVPAETGNTINILWADTFYLSIQDAIGCTYVDTVVLDEPTALTAAAITNDAQCNQCNGSATVNPSGGVPPYTYQWDAAASNQTTQVAVGLCAGIYVVDISDANGCVETITVAINDAAAETLTLSSTNVTCFGDCNGTATATSPCADGPCSVEWFDAVTGLSIGQTTMTATNLCAGTYYAQLTNNTGCITIDSIAVTDPSPIVANEVVTDVSCFGLCDGSITVSPSGGTAPYTISWPSLGQSGPTVNNLCAGTYDVVITDALACDTTYSINVSENTQLVATTTATDVSCNGLCDGQVAAVINGGNAPYTFQWIDCATSTPIGGANNDTLFNACAGDYQLQVTDANNCSVLTPCVTITEPVTLSVSATGTDVTCNGANDGTIDATVIGGTLPYTYAWNPGGFISEDLSGIGAGTYTLVVTDANGCTATTSVTINEPTAITATFTTVDATCGICDGEATITVSGGAGGYTILWSDGSNGTNVTGLCGGTYMAQVTDADGCSESFIVNVNNSNAPTIDNIATTDESCFGTCDGTATVTVSGGTPPYSFFWTHNGNTTNSETNLCAGNYDLEITDALGCVVVAQVTINTSTAITDNATITPATCGQFDGAISVVPAGGTGGYSFNWTPSVTGQGTANAINLSPGIYTLEITDNAGCSQSFTYNLNGTAAPQVTLSATDLICFGVCDGAIDATINSGTSPYVFNWTNALGVSVGNTEDLSNLCEGTYTLEVTDANGCSSFSTIDITTPDTLIATTSFVQDASCGGVCDGVININVIGGILPYTYVWTDGSGAVIPGAVTDNLSNLCADTYTIIVQDANGCTASPIVITVNEPVALSATFNTIDASCGVSDGSAEVIVTGGSAPYTYQWYDATPTALGTNSTQNNIPAGIYTVDVTDNAGCTQTFTVTVNNANAPNIALNALSDASCAGACDGSIDVTITGGTLPYSIVWNPGGQNTEDINNLCTGTYVIQVTDGAGCISFATYFIIEPTAVAATVATNDATCGQCNGSATVTPTSGVAPFTYLWSATGNTTDTETGLCPGVYDVEVTDANGCSQILQAIINDIGGPTSQTITTTPATCNGDCDGTATVTAIGGTAPISYLWLHNASTSQSVNNLCAGTYFVTMTDANGCSLTASVVITEPGALQDSVYIVTPTCGQSDGSINLTVTGGTAPYTYLWNTNDVTPNISNLPAGIYSVDVTDANGCVTTITVNLPSTDSPSPVVDAITNVICNADCNGSVTISATGGVTPYSFDLFDNGGNPTGLSGATITNLCAGDYTMQVTDALGCIGFVDFTIIEPDAILFNAPTVTDASCAGACDGFASAVAIGGSVPLSYAWSPVGTTGPTASNLCAGNYDVTVTDANGCTATETVTVNEPAAIVITIDATVDPQCFGSFDGSIDVTVSGGAGGFTYGWTGPNGFASASEDLAGIEAGLYIITATDQNGCTLTDSVQLNPQIPVVADAGIDTFVCQGGDVWLVGTGGNTYEWFDSLGNSLGTNDSLLITPLTGSNFYVLEATIGPCSDLDTVVVTANPLPNVDAGPDQAALEGETVVIGGSPTGPSGSTFDWSPSALLDDSTSSNPTATVEGGEITYVVTVTTPEGCVGTDTVVVTPVPDIWFPDGITPNGDGKNDVWIIDNIQQFPNSVVEIYNRWGQLLFRSVGYVEQWDGTYNGEELPVGTYYYVIELNDPLYDKAFTGPITILR